ncbi:hypothetical protein DPMN_043761 [Dreissena polymorpha]|uniref:Uncharacterized protein n=1 Tax=Dreissena polymorpha TaxID=45954 RepID=A0A9D4D3B8_DREPO|nr:hypothetical protein DPMN_043761 [Dreissena polymorpha]
MVRKARDTGCPLVPYETASPGRLPRPRPREMVRKARGSRQSRTRPQAEAALRDPGCERWSARPGMPASPVRDGKRRPPSETPAARDGPQGQGHGVPLVETAFRDPGCERWSAKPGTRGSAS